MIKMIPIIMMMLVTSYAKLRVMSPTELSDKLQNNNIPYSVANFGHIPWGRQIIGSILIADPIDACKPITQSEIMYWEKPFFLVKKGGCSFVTKVLNCQNSGAALVIIMDDSIQALGQLVMADDGFGYKVNIPSVVISEADGLILEQFTKEHNAAASVNPTSMKVQSHVVLVIHFDTNKAESVQKNFYTKTEVNLALTFQNRESFKLIRDFKPYYEKLKDGKVTFKIFYDQHTSPYSFNGLIRTVRKDCLGGGLYCQYNPDAAKVATGLQIMEEELRQLCLFQTDQKNWWNYIPKFDEECILIQAYEDCSIGIMKSLWIDKQKIDSCIRDSFDQTSDNDRLLQKNYILDQQRQFKHSSGLRFYPGAVINNQTYLGAIDALEIFGEICNSMIEPTAECTDQLQKAYSENHNLQNNSHITTIIICVLLILTVFFVFMVFVYRRMIRKELQRDMSSQVNQMVSHYISFYEGKDKKESL